MCNTHPCDSRLHIIVASSVEQFFSCALVPACWRMEDDGDDSPSLASTRNFSGISIIDELWCILQPAVAC